MQLFKHQTVKSVNTRTERVNFELKKKKKEKSKIKPYLPQHVGWAAKVLKWRFKDRNKTCLSEQDSLFNCAEEESNAHRQKNVRLQNRYTHCRTQAQLTFILAKPICRWYRTAAGLENGKVRKKSDHQRHTTRELSEFKNLKGKRFGELVL